MGCLERCSICGFGELGTEAGVGVAKGTRVTHVMGESPQFWKAGGVPINE